MKKVLYALGWFGLATVAHPLPPSSSPTRLTSAVLNSLVELARTNHPALRAAERRRDAANLAAEGVRLWEDPRFRFAGAIADERGPNLEMEGDLIYSLEQELPLFGKATARRRAAEASIAKADAAADYRFQLIRRSVVQAAEQLAYADQVLRIGAQDVALLERMTSFARERQRAGLDSNLDLLRLENERQKREQQLVTDRLQRDFEAVTLNRLLVLPPESPWPTLEPADPPPSIPLTERLFSLGLRNEPLLRVLQRESTMAEAEAEVTQRSRLPDVSVGIQGRQWSGTGAFREGMFSVGLNLPWFNRSKYRADLHRDRARAEAVRADAADYELEVRRELFRIWTRIDASRRETLLYRDSIIPRAQLAVETALAAWAAGRGGFLDVLEARRVLNEARLAQARAANEQHQMIAELVTCCGIAELDSLLMLQPDPASVPPSPAP